MKLNLRILFFIFISLVFIDGFYGEDSIDLSDKLLQPRHIILYPFGDEGFGFYDYGDNIFKIFDWNFNIRNKIPIKKGEGPGEVRRLIITACLHKDKLLLIPWLENKMFVFSRKGPFIKNVQLDIFPRKMVNVNNRIYVFNSRFSGKGSPPLLAAIIDPESGRKIKEILIKERLLPVETGDELELAGLGSYFDIGENNKIYLLAGRNNTIFEIDETGKCSWEISLPYKEREKRWQEEIDGKMELVISSLDFYIDMKIIKNIPYVCFYKTIKKGKTSGEDIYQTYVIKVLKNGKHQNKIFDGTYGILGENNGKLYLFNHDDYKVVPVKLSEWD